MSTPEERLKNSLKKDRINHQRDIDKRYNEQQAKAIFASANSSNRYVSPMMLGNIPITNNSQHLQELHRLEQLQKLKELELEHKLQLELHQKHLLQQQINQLGSVGLTGDINNISPYGMSIPQVQVPFPYSYPNYNMNYGMQMQMPMSMSNLNNNSLGMPNNTSPKMVVMSDGSIRYI